MELVTPAIKYKKSFLDAVEEGLFNNRKTSDGKPFVINEGNFALYLKELISATYKSKVVLCADGKYYDRVPQSTYWLVDGDKFIGHFDIRHNLNSFLLQRGGHIGYAIRPHERRKGYATEGLKLTLKKAKKIGLNKVMISADETNVGSWKAIEKNGGVLENVVNMPWNPEGPKLKRYWIKL